jgi:hypothetical protein
VNVKLSEGFSIQPEIYYATRGFKVDQNILGVPLTGKVKIRYLEIPLLVKVNVPVNLSLKPVLFAGPYLAWRVGAKTVLEYLEEKEEEDIKDEIKGTDFGLILGVGFEYKVGSVNLLFDARLSFGLTNIDDIGTNIKRRNRAIVFLAGVGI